jgi:signal transduction histidine kinase
MRPSLERRHGGGRRRTDQRDTRALRGLLHDVGHELTTLSYLVEAVRGDVALPDDSGCRLELLSLEMDRLLGIIRHGLAGLVGPAGTGPVGVRELAAQLAALAQAGYPTDVRLLPGPEVTVVTSPVLLWRVLSNLVDNAVRAAGPKGHVTLSAQAGQHAVVEVTDNGPGFGAAPPGEASLGLEIATSLLRACGGSLAVDSPPGGGTTMRVVLPLEAAAVATAEAGLPG